MLGTRRIDISLKERAKRWWSSAMILWNHYLWQMYMKWIIYENRGNEIKWTMILAAVNAIYAIAKEVWKKNPGLQRDLNPWPRDTGATFLPTKLWSHRCWELASYKFICSRERVYERFSYMIHFIYICQISSLSREHIKSWIFFQASFVIA